MTASVTVHHGDSREVLKGIADASIDSVVCDPPYALVATLKRFANSPRSETTELSAAGPYARTGRGFMGQKWDTGETAHDPAFWVEVLRVLKPGGHVVAFSGTRTYHRLACAIEDAGFELRDMIAWLYGSGFPKSHDVSKGIDKAGGVSTEAQSVLLRRKREAAGLSREQVAQAVCCSVSSVRDWEEGRARSVGAAVEFIVPSVPYRSALAGLLGYTADERRTVGLADDRRGDGSVVGLGHSGVLRAGGNTELARRWEGWGTALKPALEPVVLARKPLDGTVAGNVLEHGTGALNINGCRIEGGKTPAPVGKFGGSEVGATGLRGVRDGSSDHLGRWPANVVHDGSDEVVGAFPETSSGVMRAGTRRAAQDEPGSVCYGTFGGDATSADTPGDSGSAARFFYSAKADAEDRLGSKHPTVKPVDLMAWLCRLVTPPGGTVLDPFAGTGTTGLAAMREGFDCILIEREAQYVADINRRLAWARGEGRLTVLETGKVEPDKAIGADLPLFAGDAA